MGGIQGHHAARNANVRAGKKSCFLTVAGRVGAAKHLKTLRGIPAGTVRMSWGLAYDDLGSSWEICVVIEPILLGIVLGMVVVTLAGLFVAAYRQYQRGNKFGL
jgi:cytochrome b6-f complex subunit 5